MQPPRDFALHVYLRDHNHWTVSPSLGPGIEPRPTRPPHSRPKSLDWRRGWSHAQQAAPSQKTRQRPSYGLVSFALSGFCRNLARNHASSPASHSLAPALSPLVMTLARTQHHPVCREDRLLVLTGGDMSDGENRHCNPVIRLWIACIFRTKNEASVNDDPLSTKLAADE